MDNDKLLNFVSRFVIIVPITVIVLALIFKPQQKNLKKEKIIITPSIEVQKKSNISLKIDLNKEYKCNFQTKEATQTAYIKNKKIFIESINKINNKEKVLFSTDCLYFWKESEYSGEKICGLSTYVPTVEKLLGSGLLDVNTIINSLKGSQNFSKQDNADLNLENLECKEENVSSISFEIPKNILFKNKKL